MQKIKLIEITPGDGFYSVYLGNGTTHKFKSEKQARAFLAAAGKFLTSQLYNLHDIYGAILQKYNDCWAYMDRDAIKARKLREELQLCETSFERAVLRCGLKDGNAWAFIHLNHSIVNLKNVVKVLERENFKRSLAHQRYQLDNLFTRLQLVKNDLTTYGQRTADVIAMPQHLTQMQVAG